MAPTSGIERRRDPRTSKPFSLHNLLKTRAEAEGLVLAVVGTPDGFIMASSRDRSDKQSARLAAHASAELFGAERKAFFSRTAPTHPEIRLLGLKLEALGRPLFVAALVPSNRAFSLEALSACVKRILGETPLAVAA